MNEIWFIAYLLYLSLAEWPITLSCALSTQPSSKVTGWALRTEMLTALHGHSLVETQATVT